MKNGLLALRRAKQPACAAPIRFIFFFGNGRLAFGAFALQSLVNIQWLAGVHPFNFLALIQYHAHYFRNHIARAAHDDRIAHAHIFALRLAFVVQRGICHRYAAHEHGC